MARREFELSEEALAKLKEAGRSLPYIVVGGVAPESARTRANREWERLGREMGFDYTTVLPVPSKGERFFTAERTGNSAAYRMPGGNVIVVRSGPPPVGAVLIEDEEEQVPGHGYVEVDVRLMRQGHGPEGGEYAEEQRRTVRIEEMDARWIGRACLPEDEQKAERGALRLAEVEHAIRDVLDADEVSTFEERFQAVLARRPSPEKLRAALEILER